MRLLQSGRIPLWVLPVLLSILFFQIRGVDTSPDSAWYIALALNLYKGLGYLEIDWSPEVSRGPVFPGLIALSFWLFGVSVKSALWVVRLFFVLNVGLIYAIGAKFFNRTTGLIAALLVLTSFTAHRLSSYILLDNVVPFFILLAYLLLFMAFEEKKNLYFGLAGFVLGVAFLTKEIAALFLLLPALLWIFVSPYRGEKSWRGVLIFWGVALAIIGAWFLYAHFAGDGRGTVVDRGVRHLGLWSSAGGGGATSLSVLGQWISSLWLWLKSYYQNYLVSTFALAPLFLLAWGYISFRAMIKASRAEKVLLSGLVLFLPLILHLGNWPALRVGQSFYLFLLSYLALARLLWAVASDLPRHKIWMGIGMVITLLALAVQIWVGDRGFIHFLKHFEPSGIVPNAGGVYTMSFGRDDWEVGGWHNEFVEEAGEWLRDNTAPGDPMLIDWYWARSLYFYLGARQPVHMTSYISSRDIEPIGHASLAPILFIWPQAGKTNPMTSKLNALPESRFLAQMRELNIKYVVVTPRRNFLTLYLRANPGFEEIKQFGSGQIKIFKVQDQLSSIGFPTHIDPRTVTYMHRAAEENPVLYERLVEEYFVGRLGATRTQIEEIMTNGNIGRLIEVGRIY